MINTTSNPSIDLIIPTIPYLSIFHKLIKLVNIFYYILNKYNTANMSINYNDYTKLVLLKKRIDNLTRILNQLYV